MHDSSVPNAPERESSDHAVSEETLARVREALRLSLAGACPDGVLSSAMHHLADEARARGLRAEQVIILLKRMWDELADGSHLVGEQYAAMSSRLITRAIDAYYRTDA